MDQLKRGRRAATSACRRSRSTGRTAAVSDAVDGDASRLAPTGLQPDDDRGRCAIHIGVVRRALPRAARLARASAQPSEPLMTISLRLARPENGRHEPGRRAADRAGRARRRSGPNRSRRSPPKPEPRSPCRKTPPRARRRRSRRHSDAAVVTTRPPSTGAQVTPGTARANTDRSGRGTGLTCRRRRRSGANATFDPNFCCLDYVQDVARAHQRAMEQGAAGDAARRRSSSRSIATASIHQAPRSRSRAAACCSIATSKRAFDGLRLPPLPAEYTERHADDSSEVSVREVVMLVKTSLSVVVRRRSALLVVAAGARRSRRRSPRRRIAGSPQQPPARARAQPRQMPDRIRRSAFRTSSRAADPGDCRPPPRRSPTCSWTTSTSSASSRGLAYGVGDRFRVGRRLKALPFDRWTAARRGVRALRHRARVRGDACRWKCRWSACARANRRTARAGLSATTAAGREPALLRALHRGRHPREAPQPRRRRAHEASRSRPIATRRA